jgi:LacI family transcriptional regulator
VADFPYVAIYRHRAFPLADAVLDAFRSAWIATQPYPLIKIRGKGESQLNNPACLGWTGFLSDPAGRELGGRARVPVVNFSNRLGPVADCINVLFDDCAVGALAAEHLVQKNFRQFCCVGHLQHHYARERAEGFRHYLQSKGYQVEILDWKEFDPTRNPLREKSKAVDWVSGVLRGISGPTGILATSDVIAERFLCFANEVNPEKNPWLGIVGVDNSLLAHGRNNREAFTSIELPSAKLAQTIVSVLAEAVQSGKREMRVLRVEGARVVERASTGAPVSDDLFLARIIRHIHEEMVSGNCPSVQALASSFGVTPRALLARFQRKMNQSLRDYILHTRLRRAAMLLVDTSMSITDIAQSSGFAKHASLTEHFGKAYGMTPSAFRDTHKSGG